MNLFDLTATNIELLLIKVTHEEQRRLATCGIIGNKFALEVALSNKKATRQSAYAILQSFYFETTVVKL